MTIKYNLVYKSKKEKNYQYGFWHDFISIEHCIEEFLKLTKKDKIKQFNIVLLDNNNKESIYYDI